MMVSFEYPLAPPKSRRVSSTSSTSGNVCASHFVSSPRVVSASRAIGTGMRARYLL